MNDFDLLGALPENWKIQPKWIGKKHRDLGTKADEWEAQCCPLQREVCTEHRQVYTEGTNYPHLGKDDVIQQCFMPDNILHSWQECCYFQTTGVYCDKQYQGWVELWHRLSEDTCGMFYQPLHYGKETWSNLTDTIKLIMNYFISFPRMSELP